MSVRNLVIGLFGSGSPMHRGQKLASKCGNSLSLELLEDRCLLSGDVVLEWNATLLQAIRTAKTPPPPASRHMAIVQTAVFDAVNAIDQTYIPFVYHGRGPRGASLEAAAAQAAHDTLVALYPTQRSTFDAQLASDLATLANGPAKIQGIQVGEKAARECLEARSNDGASATVTYTPGSGPGVWVPTPPGLLPSAFPQWPNVSPFTMTSGDQFRPNGPPALTSAAYAANFNEVKELGAINSATRTTDQTEIALFWADGPGTETPPGHWNSIAADVANAVGTTLVQNARLLALLDLALADAAIAAWDAKYVYNYWRPVTAIRAADTDGNPDTVQDSTWTPLLVTPNFPSYTSGHSTFSSAGAAVLASFFGTDNISFTTGSDFLPGVTRSFTSFSAAAAEAGQSRIYGGIHYQFDNQDALSAGNALGNYVAQNFLTLREPLSSAATASQAHGNNSASATNPVIAHVSGGGTATFDFFPGGTIFTVQAQIHADGTVSGHFFCAIPGVVVIVGGNLTSATVNADGSVSLFGIAHGRDAAAGVFTDMPFAVQLWTDEFGVGHFIYDDPFVGPSGGIDLAEGDHETVATGRIRIG